LLNGTKWAHRYYYWVPTCFTMMPFVAVFMIPHLKKFQSSSGFRWKWISVMLLISFGLALVEWRFALPVEQITATGWRNWLPKHARLSVHFSAIGQIAWCVFLLEILWVFIASIRLCCGVSWFQLKTSSIRLRLDCPLSWDV
jgi:hypothetical protein